MTAQIEDLFRYDNAEYSLAGISEGNLFDISVVHLKPTRAGSACWRGYQAVFALAQSQLVLEALRVNLLRPAEGKQRNQREEGPIVNGITPSPPQRNHGFFNNYYERLNFHLKYSRGLVIANGFIRSLYAQMGCHPPWKYETVIELVFDAGTLKHAFDRSEQTAEFRELVIKAEYARSSTGMPSMDEINAFVEQAFDRSYAKEDTSGLRAARCRAFHLAA